MARGKGEKSTEVKVMDAAVALLLYQGTGEQPLFDLCRKLLASIGEN